MVQTYRKKPEEVQVLKWTGNNKKEVNEFCPCAWWIGMSLRINTKDGTDEAKEGDFIIKNSFGYFHVCNPETFKMRYEKG